MTSQYDLYGFLKTELEAAAAFVTTTLGIALAERDSGYYGGTYYLYRLGPARSLRLYRNRDPETGAFVRKEHQGFLVLLEVSDLENMPDIQRRLTERDEPVLLTSRVLTTTDEEAEE